jgi:hypothetical protein
MHSFADIIFNANLPEGCQLNYTILGKCWPFLAVAIGRFSAQKRPAPVPEGREGE